MASLLLPSCGVSQKHSPSLACPIPRRRLQRDSPILLIGWQARKGRRITADSVVRGVSSSASTSSYPTSFASSAGPVVFRDLDADDFRHPLDKQNTLLLRAIPGLNEFGKALLGPVSEQIMLLENIGTSVLVADNQLPDIYQLLVEAAKILNVEAPDVYVRQNPVPNAYTLAISGRKPFIVVHTSLVELLNRKELQVVISLLMKLSGGCPSLSDQLNVDAFLEQARSYDKASSSPLGWYMRNAQTRQLSHPLPVLRAREIDQWSRSQEYRSLMRRAAELERNL